MCVRVCACVRSSLLLGIGERSAAMVTHLHETEPKTGSGYFSSIV